MPSVSADDEDEWVRLQSSGTPVKELHARLLNQYDGAWELGDDELDVAAYEALLLALGTSKQFLKQRERETLDYMRSKFGFSRRMHNSIASMLVEGAPEEEAEEIAEQDLDHLEGWLEKAGEKNKSFKQRWFVLDGTQIDYYAKQGQAKAKGSLTSRVL